MRLDGVAGASLATAFLLHALISRAQEPAPALPTPAPRAAVETDESVVLNFEGADIREVIHSLATALGIHYVIDPRVQGQVTIRTTGKIARRDLFPVFHQILRANGITAIKAGAVYQIGPVGEAKTRALLPESAAERRGAMAEDRFTIELVRVEHVAAEELAKVLQPFVSPGGDVMAYPRGNLVIVADLTSSVERLKELIRAFDTDTFRELHTQVYHIEHANVEEVGEELKGMLAPYGVTPKSAEERGVYIIPLKRLNAVVVVGFNLEVFAQVEKWLQVLNVPPEKGGGRTVHVYAVENTKAADLAAVLGGLYGSEGRGGGSGSSRQQSGLSGRGSDDSGSGGSPGSSGGASGSGLGGSRGSSKSGQSSRSGGGASGGSGTQTVTTAPKEGERPIFKEEVHLVADETTNSLVILATARDYEMIRDVLRKLDIVPRQVLIETIIAEVGLSGGLEFGVEYVVANGGIGDVLGSSSSSDDGTDDETDSSTSSGSISDSGLLQEAKRGVHVSDQGLFAFITDRDQFFVALKALASQSRLNILSTPHVIAADNREAHILIGKEIPILTSSATSTLTDDSTTVNSIQYRDTGKILTILPQVNSAGLVNMEIRQEVSDVDTTSFGDTGSPSFISREAETTVVVQNGESVLLGGIIDDQLRRSRSGVPYLMDIPVLGRLFRVESESVDRTELLILITPHVIRDRQEARSITEEFESRIRSLKGMLERVQQPKNTTESP